MRRVFVDVHGTVTRDVTEQAGVKTRLREEVLALLVGEKNGLARAVLFRLGRIGALRKSLLRDQLRALERGIDVVGPVGHFCDEHRALQVAAVDRRRLHQGVEVIMKVG